MQRRDHLAIVVLVIGAWTTAARAGASDCAIDREPSPSPCTATPTDPECRLEWLAPRIRDAEVAAAAKEGAERDAAEAAAAPLITAFEAGWATAPYCKRRALLPLLASLDRRRARVLEDEVDRDDRAAQATAYAAEGCDRAGTLCLDREGHGIAGDAQSTVDEGDQLTVLVLSPYDADQGDALRVILSIAHNLDSMTAGAGGPKSTAGEDGKPHYQVVARTTGEAIPESARALRIDIQRKAGSRYERVSQVEIRVNHGHYYFEFGLSLAFVHNGAREAIAPTVIEQRTEPRGAVGVLYFPLGRDKGRIDYFSPTRWCGRELFRPLSHALGFVLATDFDFSTLRKDYHAGIAWSPVAGLALTGGVSLVPAQFLEDDLSAPGSGTAPPYRTRNILRPFVGIFLTTEFLDTASKAVTTLRALHK